jgi:hypothetical protein
LRMNKSLRFLMNNRAGFLSRGVALIQTTFTLGLFIGVFLASGSVLPCSG